MMIRVNKAFASREGAERALSNYPVGDRDCHVSAARLAVEDAMRIYGVPEVWIVSGEVYR